ncbi:MAG: ATP-binding protein [Pyrinomonadaceae bacterium MAG19_C2-C3]|nr:ATP-binding protein [Pyrinomonadaceae bacterium MAG19_C2-C3]
MAVATIPGKRLDNRLLAALPAEEHERLLSQMDYVSLRLREVLHEPDDIIRYVYFPSDCVVSLVSNMESGATAAVSMIGNEGFVGLPVFLGGEKSFSQAVVQVKGTALRMKAGDFKDALTHSRALTDLLHLYTQAQLTQTSQIAACNCFHRIEERLARLLLLIHDRVGGDDLPLTQELLSHMLGVRRSGVTVAAGKLQEAELIGYMRGNIRILDRVSLEAASCECYEVIRAEFDRLLLVNLVGRITSAQMNISQPAPRRADERRSPEPNRAAVNRPESSHTEKRETERRQAGRRREDKEHAARLETLRDVNSRLLLAGIREQEARDEAEAANLAKDEFLATLSHELRTPLTAIVGWSRMLRTRRLDSVTSARALAIIERNAEAQVQLTEDLLNMSRIVAGKLRIDVGTIELGAVVGAAVDGARPEAEKKRLELRFVSDAEAVRVSGDGARLQQIVSNLLTNAIKFTPEGGSVMVRLERTRSHAQITVSDTGEGIFPEFLPHVFDRFRQADNTTTRTHGGLGLGLAIVRHLTELHGGTIRVESDGVGRGATFTVELPLASGDAQTGDAGDAGAARLESSPVESAATQFECAASLDGLRVLIVEDDSDTREVLVLMLKECKADVTAVTTAREAFKTIEKIKPHVILSDIGMPGEDGYELIRRLRSLSRARGGQIPAAAVTAYVSDGDRERALAAGYQVHLPKPIEPSRLVAVVAHLAGRI